MSSSYNIVCISIHSICGACIYIYRFIMEPWRWIIATTVCRFAHSSFYPSSSSTASERMDGLNGRFCFIRSPSASYTVQLNMVPRVSLCFQPEIDWDLQFSVSSLGIHRRRRRGRVPLIYSDVDTGGGAARKVVAESPGGMSWSWGYDGIHYTDMI